MADLRLLGDPEQAEEQSDGAEIEESGQDGVDSPASDGSDQQQQQGDSSAGQDGGLPLASNLARFAESDNIFNRQMVARTLLDTLRSVAHLEEDVTTVLSVLLRLSEDPEPSVRTELVEQVPHLAAFCQCHVASQDSEEEQQQQQQQQEGLATSGVGASSDEACGNGGQQQRNGGVLREVLPRYLLPLVVRYLADPNNQVRKTSQVALLSLLEQRMLRPEELEEQVCPVILHLTDIDSMDNFRPEAVALMCRMATMLGKELTQSLFLDRFVGLCSDGLFQVRKVCAIHFGDLCAVMGPEITESVLLPRFVCLCNDEMWGVRKACADVFVAVACVCSLTTRRQHLAQLFVALLADQSRWVRLAIFQALGPFISTFADPTAQQLYYDQDGNVHVAHRPEDEDCESDQLPRTPPSPTDATPGDHGTTTANATTVGSNCTSTGGTSNSDGSAGTSPMELLEETGCCSDSGFGSREASTVGSPGKEDDDELEAAAEALEDQEFMQELGSILALRHGIKEKDTTSLSTTGSPPPTLQPAYDSFLFWRQPIAELDELEPDFQMPEVLRRRSRPVRDTYDDASGSEPPPPPAHEGSGWPEIGGGVYRVLRRDAPDSDRDLFGMRVRQRGDSFGNPFEERAGDGQQQNQGQPPPPPGELHYHLGKPVFCAPRPRLPSALSCALQDVVPAELLNHFVHMNDPSLIEHLDSEIARFCAHSLPAVALTLGRKHWPLLRALYECLASDMQWKVRRTLAFSIHELAAILGRDLAASDLVPVFNSFIRDLDEVRIGILRHLARFLSLLPSAQRGEYLPHVHKFLEPENERNWRFRLELAEQLAQMAHLFPAPAVAQHLMPVAVRLLADRVAEVRNTAADTLGQLVRHLTKGSSEQQQQQDQRDGLSWRDPVLDPEPDWDHDMLDDEEEGGGGRPYDLRPLVYLSLQLVGDFAEHPKWHRRQTFVVACQHVRPHLPLRRVFAAHLLPPLLKLTADPVANVRLVVARVLADVPLDRLCPAPRGPETEPLLLDAGPERTVMTLEDDFPSDPENFKLLQELMAIDNSERNSVIRALERLRHDLDRDVRAAALRAVYPALTTSTTSWSGEDNVVVSCSSSAVPLLLNGGVEGNEYHLPPPRTSCPNPTPPY